jgi:hypothetical protein
MKKNQKYTQEEMYLAIALRKESGLSQQKYCRQNGGYRNLLKLPGLRMSEVFG